MILRYLGKFAAALCFTLVLAMPQLAYSGDKSPGKPCCEFSALVSDTSKADPSQNYSGKIFVTKQRFREEGLQRGVQEVTIYDFARNLTWMLRPERKQYAEFPGVQAVHPLSGANLPCPKDARFECKKLGEEKLHDRRCEKWSMVRKDDPRHTTVTRWIDKRLNMVVREEDGEGGVFEVIQIKEGRQAEALFSIPSGYQPVINADEFQQDMNSVQKQL